MRIIVTGSREFTDFDLVYRVLWRQLEAAAVLRKQLTVVHGGCSGADLIVSDWYRMVQLQGGYQSRFLGPLEIHEADWSRHGLSAGPIRNEHMAELGADVCIGFLKRGAKNKGTVGMLNAAKRRGIHTVYHTD